MSRITHFWGFPKAMGAIYGAIYLSPQSVSLDELVELVGVSKGAVSTNVRLLERLGMVHRQVQVGDRKDYYLAETDFWKVARTLLKERDAVLVAHYYVDGDLQDLALATGGMVADSLEMARFGRDHSARTLVVAGWWP